MANINSMPSHSTSTIFSGAIIATGLSKRPRQTFSVMDVVLSAVLRSLHPFMPHITEELWSLLGFGEKSIQFEPTPKKFGLDDVDLAGKRKLVAAIYETVQAGRNLRAEAKISSSTKARFILRADEKEVSDHLPAISRLLNAEEVILDPKHKSEPGIPVAMTPLGEIFL